MKTILLITTIALFSSCTLSEMTSQSNYKIAELSDDELARFEAKGKSLFYNNKKVATIGSLDYEYYEGNYIMEVSMIQHSAIYNEMTEKIAYYMSSNYPEAKIEVKVEREAYDTYGLNNK